MPVEVLKPGLATSVQDAGREGYYHLGIPLSGAMDQHSFLAANLLVGNDENAAVLEVTLLGPELAFRQDAIVAVTGAELEPRVNGQARPTNESFPVREGEVLSFGIVKGGARAYLAIAGGVDVPVVLGSRSTYGLGAFGGFQGRALKAGDVLPVGRPGPAARAGRRLAPELRRPLPRELDLRVVPGLYHHRLTEQSARNFWEDVWSVAPEADRIGYRYRHGRPLQWKERKQPFGAGSDPSNIVDAGYPFGSIQVPGGLEPIVLHRDAVSGGGYAMIGTVISADMDCIAQMQPNHKARFVPVDMEAALAARGEYRARLDRIRSALSNP
jgi:biotin-dependent carboxylase-like uncharacterized protein